MVGVLFLGEHILVLPTIEHARRGVLLQHLRHGLHQVLGPFFGCQAGRHPDDALVRPDACLLPECLHILFSHPGYFHRWQDWIDLGQVSAQERRMFGVIARVLCTISSAASAATWLVMFETWLARE